MSQVAGNQHRSFASPSLTPSHQYRGGDSAGCAAQAANITSQLGPAVLPNNIIFNLNGTTHINNFHQHGGPQSYNSAQMDGMIHGRKVDRPQLRVGKEASSSNDLDNHNQNHQGQRDKRLDLHLGLHSANQGNKTTKTMIPKKLLAQAKSAKHARVTPKGILRGQGPGLTQGTDELQKVMHRHATQPGHQNLNQTTKTRDKKQKSKSQFDFNFPGNTKENAHTNVTIDYDTHQRRGTLAPNATEAGPNGPLSTSGRNDRSRRQSSFSFNNLQSLVNKQQGTSHSNKLMSNKINKAAKSSRPMTQTKQATMAKHRRHKSEVKRGYQQFPAKPMTKINTLLRQANTSISNHPAKTSNSKRGKEHNKENLNISNTGAGRSTNQVAGSSSQPPRGAAKTVAHKSHSRRQHEGMSISSFSSNSNRVNGGQSQAGSSRHNSRGRHQGSSIAEQLSKSYFLNSKQLLRHLSPARPEHQADISQMVAPNSGDRLLSQQFLSGQEGGGSGLSQRQQPSRGRNRSTAVAKASVSQGARAKQRKNHSHSQSKSYNKQQLSLRQNPQMQSLAASGSSSQQAAQPDAVQLLDEKVGKSKSPIVVNPNAPAQSQKLNKQAVDKLIKENLRKNKTKQDEECLKKQLEAVRQQQRRAELTQRNQEVRMINASKIVHHLGNAIAVGNHTNDLGLKVPTDQNLQAHTSNTSKEEPQQRRRSRSCIDYSNKKGGTAQSGGNRGGHHSHGDNWQQNRQQPSAQQPSREINQKIVPHTTTNQANKSLKPRSFVDEINQLTQLVEQEIGHDQLRLTQPKAGGNSRTKNLLNQTAIEPHVNDKTLLYKKPKQNKQAIGIQKFIERRKRAEQVKKSLEQTIEVDKQLKIQKNLDNLDKFVKRHLRQRSQPAISQKKASGSGSIALQQPNKIPQKRTKKSKASAEPVVGLSEIFHQVYTNPALTTELRRNGTPINSGDQNLSAIIHENEQVQDQTNLELEQHLKQLESQSLNQQVGKTAKNNSFKTKATSQSKKASNHASAKQPGKSRKNAPQDKVLQSSAGTRVETASGTGPHRKSSAQGTSNVLQQQRNTGLQPSKQISGPDALPSNQFFSNPLQQRLPIALKSQTTVNKSHHSHHFSQPEQSNWLTKKHPGSDHLEERRGSDQARNKGYNRAANQPLRNFNKLADIDLTPGSQAHEQAANKQSKPKRGEPEHFKDDTGHSKTDLSMTSITPSGNLNDNWDQDGSNLNVTRKDQSLNQSVRLSPKSTENIRRVHELVALYRCRFKANVSDASVMGTLHSAASVIQIHFRYLRHLKEAELGTSAAEEMPSLQQQHKTGDSKEQRYLNELESSPGYIDSDKEDNELVPASRHLKSKKVEEMKSNKTKYRETNSKQKYIDTTEKKRSPHQDKLQSQKLNGFQNLGEHDDPFLNKYRFVDRLTPADSSRSGDSAALFGKNVPGNLLGHEQGRGAKEYISSVLPASAWGSGPAPTALLASAASSGIATPAQQMVSKQSTSQPHGNTAAAEEHKEASGKKTTSQHPQRANNKTGEKRIGKKEEFTNKNEKKQQNQLLRKKARPSIDVEVVEEDYRLAQLKQEKYSQPSSKDQSKQSPSLKGSKTPQVPGLDLDRLHDKKTKQGQNKRQNEQNGKQNVEKSKEQEIDFYGHQAERPGQDIESLNSYSQQTVSSYRGIFNRLGLPLPRSARVKVDYALVQKDPKITEQLKEIVRFKDVRGRQVMEEGRRDNLITERTYEINRRKLEKWVSSSYNKIEDNQQQKSAKKTKIPTQEELLQATQEDRKRLQGLLHEGDRLSAHSATGRPSGRQSGRQHSHMSQSWRGGQAAGMNGNNQYPSYRAGESNKGENYTDRDPYGHGSRGNSNTTDNYKASMAIGSGRQQRSKLVELINSSRTSSKPKKDQSASDSRKNPAESSSYGGQEPARLEDVQIHINEQKVAEQERPCDPERSYSKQQPQGRAINYVMNDRDGAHLQSNTEKSLNRSQSHPTIHNELERDMPSDLDVASDNEEDFGSRKKFEDIDENLVVDHNKIEYQLEDALRNEHRKLQAEKSSQSSTRLERDELSQYQAQKNSHQATTQHMSGYTKPAGDIEDIRNPRFFIRQVGEDGEVDSSKKKSDQIKDFTENDVEQLAQGRGGIQEENPDKPSSKVKPNPFKSRTPQTILQVNNFLEPTANETDEIEEESSAGKNIVQEDKQSDQMTGPRNSMNSSDEERNKDQTGITNANSTALSGSRDDEDKTLFGYSNNQSYLDASKGSSNNIIKVENQLNDDFQEASLVSSPVEDKNTFKETGEKEPIKPEQHQKQIDVGGLDNIALGHPVSPVSDSQAYEFKIQTGAHSLSSTDSDMAKAIHAANRDYDSPPDLISPKNQKPSLTVVDQQDSKLEQEQFADQIAHYILSHLVAEASEEMESLVSRPQLHPQKPGERYIKYFDQKGIKTNLFAIEKYFDEVLEEVQQTREEFMKEINRPLSRNQLETLYHMQNSEIGSYDHFQQNLPPILSLDLYLNLEKRRKESRENPNVFLKNGKEVGPNGLFDFENVTDEDLKQDQVDKNYLAECQHIHNKVLFDCINDCLQQFRPHGKDGAPMVWSRLGRKLKPTEDFTLEEMFEITKHDLYQMAITQSGTLPRREFVFGGKFDDELFAEIREKKLAGLLCREIIETEPQWLKWDFEEAQTKIDIGDMVLEALVTETIEFLNKKQQTKKSTAQSNFENLQEQIIQASPGSLR